MRQVKLPHRLLKILESESLWNDARALLGYRLAIMTVIAGPLGFGSFASVFLLTVFGSLVACNAEIGRRCPYETGHAAALQMLAMPRGIAALCALHRTPSRTFLASRFNVTGH
jgi:hypothetical protein